MWLWFRQSCGPRECLCRQFTFFLRCGEFFDRSRLPRFTSPNHQSAMKLPCRLVQPAMRWSLAVALAALALAVPHAHTPHASRRKAGIRRQRQREAAVGADGRIAPAAPTGSSYPRPQRGYNTSSGPQAGVINVHLFCHSHDDVGEARGSRQGLGILS